MFSNRLAVNADVFFSRTKDLVTRRPLNDEAGLEYFWDNDGEMKNNGLEVAVKVRALDMRDFKLNIGATVGHYKNEVTSLENGSFITEVCDGQVLTEVVAVGGIYWLILRTGSTPLRKKRPKLVWPSFLLQATRALPSRRYALCRCEKGWNYQ